MTDTAFVGRADLHTPDLATPETPMSTLFDADTSYDTDNEAAARLVRIAQLQQRRAAGSRPVTGGTATSSVAASGDPASTAPAVPGPSRPASEASRAPRVAAGSKVAAAGIGFAAMLGLVAVMGVAGRSSAAEPQPAAQLPAAPAQVVVVIHPVDGTATPATAQAAVGSIAPASSQPIVLSARPTVRQAPASPAPTGQTNGSR